MTLLLAASIKAETKKKHTNSLPPEQNGRYFAEDIFKSIFFNQKSCILMRILLSFFS